MDASKKKKLEAAGWRVGSTADFLELTPEEAEIIDVKVALGDYMRQVRREHHWTQTQVARRIGSSQSRVAKMEAADPSVTVDLQMKSLFSLGKNKSDVCRAMAREA